MNNLQLGGFCTSPSSIRVKFGMHASVPNFIRIVYCIAVGKPQMWQYFQLSFLWWRHLAAKRQSWTLVHIYRPLSIQWYQDQDRFGLQTPQRRSGVHKRYRSKHGIQKTDKNKHNTFSPPRRASYMPVHKSLRGDFEIFRPAGATCYTDRVKYGVDWRSRPKVHRLGRVAPKRTVYVITRRRSWSFAEYCNCLLYTSDAADE